MNVLLWHVHGSWATAFLQGPDDHLLPVVPDRGPDGRGRARTWDWPASAREITPAQLADEPIDVVVLQRPEELDLLTRWTGLRAGIDVPAVYVEHNAPDGPAATTRHPLADRTDIPVVHVTAFNALMWDTGQAPTVVIDHGVLDAGPLYTGERERIAVVVNEPVRRGRIAGTDIVLDLAADLPVAAYGMGTAALTCLQPALTATYDLPQAALHRELARERAYLHPYRWTSLGLSLLEAMTLGMPVLAVAATQVPLAVPSTAGVVSADPRDLADAARRWLRDPAEAVDRGSAARAHALAHFGLDRFLDDWQQLLKEAVR